MEIDFGYQFAEPPVVIITPNWHSVPGDMDIVTNVFADRFRVISQNADLEYYISWIAVGTAAEKVPELL